MARNCLLIAVGFFLASCGTVRKVGSGSMAAVKNTTSAAVAKVSSLKMPSLPKMPEMSLAGLIPGRGPKVVEVREKDLKEMPTGHELAKNYENQRRGFWIFGGPVDFKEPTLPESGSDLDGSLLPPRMP